MEIVRPARVEERPERPYVGIRVVTPFRGMLGVYDDLLKELSAWVAAVRRRRRSSTASSACT